VDFANAVADPPGFQRGPIVHGLHRRPFRKGAAEARPAARGGCTTWPWRRTIVYHNRQSLTRESLKAMATQVGPAHEPKDCNPYKVRCGRDLFEICLPQTTRPARLDRQRRRAPYAVTTPEFEFYRRRLMLKIDGRSTWVPPVLPVQLLRGRLLRHGPCLRGLLPQGMGARRAHARPAREAQENVAGSPMPGLVVDVRRQKGDGAPRPRTGVCIEP